MIDPNVVLAGRRWDERLSNARRQKRRPLLSDERWRVAVDPYGSGAWERRISWGGLGEPMEEPILDSEASSSWIKTLELVCSTEYGHSPVSGDVDIEVAFADALQPIVNKVWTRLEKSALDAGFHDSAAAGLRKALLHRLSELVSWPLGHIFTGSQSLADIAFAHIADDRPAGSFKTKYVEFCNLLVNSGFRKLFREFPVTGRLMATSINNWSDANAEFLNRLKADRTQIEKDFGIPRDAPITSLTSGLSDLHRGGRCVEIIGFPDDHFLVYKPRPVEIEAHYQEFVAAISALLPNDPLRSLKVLSCEGYGYVEYVHVQAALGPEELVAFYVNAGRILALLYLLGATDCHWENMIATSDQLLLVDAETLFEGNPYATKNADTQAKASVFHGIEDSVLRTGMLPMWISIGSARTIDVSALGAPGSEQSNQLIPSWCFTNTDDMVWGDRQVEPSSPGCLPVHKGKPNPLLTYGDHLITGFEEVFRLLAQPDVQIMARLHIEGFRGVRRRIVVRPTRIYAILQSESLEPEVLRNADDRALQLERLARAYVCEKERPRNWPILQHELKALEDLDVPYFEGIVGSSDLLLGSDVLVEGYYEHEGLKESLERLDRLSDVERNWQVRLIRGALAAHRFEMQASTNTKSRYMPIAKARNDHTADDVARYVASEVIKDPSGQLTWLTVALLADPPRVQIGLVPPGLYDGRAGIACFLYDCGQTGFANEVMQPVLKMIDQPENDQVSRYLRNIGMGMTGVGGLLRLFQYRRDVDNRIEFWDHQSSRIIAALSDELLVGDSSCDLVSGLAGLAAPLARLHAHVPTDESHRVLKTVGRFLMERQNEVGGWALAPGHPALVGLSHGASGIAVGLAEIAIALNEDRYVEAAESALDFEAAHFDPIARNWPDLRLGLPSGNQVAMRSWCHGSVGIALARLRIIELLPTHPAARRWELELTEAVESSIDATFGAVDHLCCGNAGRAVVIRLAGESSGNARWQQEGQRLSDAVEKAASGNPENYQLLLGIDGLSGLRLPGLMTGLAGLGMHLLHGSDLR